jgi:hypothetical protein
LVDKHAADNEIETEKRRKPILVRLWLDPTDHPVIMSEEYADRKLESIHQQVGGWFDGFANSPQPCRSSKKQGFGHCPVLSRHGDGVNGPSRTKIEEMARFVYKLEKMQEARP